MREDFPFNLLTKTNVMCCPISRFAKLLHNFWHWQQVHVKLRVLSGVKHGLSESCVGGRENERERIREREKEWAKIGYLTAGLSRLHTLLYRWKCAHCCTIDPKQSDVFEKQKAKRCKSNCCLYCCECVKPELQFLLRFSLLLTHHNVVWLLN